MINNYYQGFLFEKLEMQDYRPCLVFKGTTS